MTRIYKLKNGPNWTFLISANQCYQWVRLGFSVQPAQPGDVDVPADQRRPAERGNQRRGAQENAERNLKIAVDQDGGIPRAAARHAGRFSAMRPAPAQQSL